MVKRDKKARNGRSASSFDRRPGRLKPGKVVLVVCEGKTEKVYFDALKEHYRLASIADIEITDKGGTAPINVVDYSIDLIQKRQKEAEHSNFLLPYDQIWGLIDVENPAHNPSFWPAVNKAKNHTEKIRLGVSNPAFEYWFVLHFEHTSRPFANGQEIKRYLRKYIPSYEEGQNVFYDLPAHFGSVDDAIDATVDRAEHILKNCADNERYPNPSTLVFCLVQQLRQMASRTHGIPSINCQREFPDINS